MDIQPTFTNASAAAAGGAQAPSAAATVGSDFQTFLTLLTAQMRNQDPLNPIDSTDFVAQLASFSAVEQQVKTNDKLDLIFTALAGGGASPAGLADWIGREVRAPAAASFNGAPIEVEFAANPEADRAVLVVRNAFDQVVLRRAIGPEQNAVSWDGLTDSGGMAPHGSYRFEVEAYRNDTLLATQPGWAFARVTEVRLEEGEVKLVLEGGERTAATAVTGVR